MPPLAPVQVLLCGAQLLQLGVHLVHVVPQRLQAAAAAEAEAEEEETEAEG